MPDNATPVDLDAELRRIAEALVAEAPDPPGPLGDLHLPAPTRPSRRPRPRLAAAVAVPVAVLALVVAALAVTGRDPGDGPEGQVVLASDAGLEAAPQRLILDDSRELPPDGDPVRLELAGLDPHGSPRPLPDGGHVVVGVHAVASPPSGFNEFTDLDYSLVVVGAGGQVTAEREVEASALVGVTATDAILARRPRDERGQDAGPVSIVAHDLATGEERLVHEGVTFEPDRRVSTRSAVVAGDLVTVEASQGQEPVGEDAFGLVPGTEACTLRITDLATGDEVERPLDLSCTMLVGLQASPDGSRVALAYEPAFGDGTPEARLAIVDLPSGTVSEDRLIGNNVDCTGANPCPPGARPMGYRGMAWASASSLRVAVDLLDDALPRLTVDTIPVG